MKRLLHFKHSRRRRIALPSLLVLESITLSSKFPQKGHFILDKLEIQISKSQTYNFIPVWNLELNILNSLNINILGTFHKGTLLFSTVHLSPIAVYYVLLMK